jgi:hypothetical protein
MTASLNTFLQQMDFSTRKKRRRAVAIIFECMRNILAAERAYRDNIPPNLMGSELFDKADEYICRLDEVIDLLSEVYDEI